MEKLSELSVILVNLSVLVVLIHGIMLWYFLLKIRDVHDEQLSYLEGRISELEEVCGINQHPCDVPETTSSSEPGDGKGIQE